MCSTDSIRITLRFDLRIKVRVTLYINELYKEIATNRNGLLYDGCSAYPIHERE